MSNIRPYLSAGPQVQGSCYLDPLCLVAGDVVLAEEVSVWPFAVLRGEVTAKSSRRLSATCSRKMLSMLRRSSA